MDKNKLRAHCQILIVPVNQITHQIKYVELCRAENRDVYEMNDKMGFNYILVTQKVKKYTVGVKSHFGYLEPSYIIIPKQCDM